MTLQELIIEFLRENHLKITGKWLNEDQAPKPKLIRFVKGSYEYNIVFNNEEPTLHLIKQRLNARRPYKRVAIMSGGKKHSGYERTKIIVDLNNRNSFEQILNFI